MPGKIFKSFKVKIIIIVLFYLFIFSSLLYNSFNYLDPDFGWHLDSGREISLNKDVPRLERHDYTILNKPWVDHEWLVNYSVFLIYEKLGYRALNIFFAVVIIFILIILHRQAAASQGNKLFFVFILGLWGIIASLPHLGVRVQEIGLLFFTLLIFLIYEYNQRPSYKLLVALPPFFYLWASGHGSFLIGLFILFFWLAVKSLESWLKKYKEKLYFIDFSQTVNFKKILLFFAFSVLSLGATLITPYGLKLYDFLITYSNTYYLQHIAEWLPLYYLPIELWKLSYYSLFTLIIFIWLFLALKRADGGQYKINLWQIFSSILFAVLAVKSRRNFPLFFIISFPLMVSFLSAYLVMEKDFLIKKLGRMVVFVYVYLICALVILISYRLINTKFTDSPFTNYCYQYPCQAVNFLKNHPEYDGLKMFNSYSWGGYLIWELPGRKLFIDGRLPQYPYGSQTLLEEYKEFFSDKGSGSKLKQHDIGIVLLENEPPINFNLFEKYWLGLKEKDVNGKGNNLKNYLTGSKDWQLVYSDHLSLIYVKR